jgi:hypothetical protein
MGRHYRRQRESFNGRYGLQDVAMNKNNILKIFQLFFNNEFWKTMDEFYVVLLVFMC